MGMAPLSGLSRHRLASRWSRLGTLIYRHGDSFYNFEGLRAFKSKFKPVWRPRYLAHPGGLSMARVLMDATRLIGASPQRASIYEGFPVE
jgi:phosphatidylglycerol lysyltransferase